MNRIYRIGRSLAGLTRRAGALLVYGVAVPAALASPRPRPPGWNKHPPLPAHTHPVIGGGMPGWQISLIAAAAALLVTALAVPLTGYRLSAGAPPQAPPERPSTPCCGGGFRFGLRDRGEPLWHLIV